MVAGAATVLVSGVRDAGALGAGPGVQDLTEDSSMVAGGMAGSRIIPGAAIRGLSNVGLSNVSRAKQDAIIELIPSFGPKLVKLRALGDPVPPPSVALDTRSMPSAGGRPVPLSPAPTTEPFVYGGGSKPPVPTDVEPRLEKSTSMRFGGPPEPTYGEPSGGSAGANAPRPMPGAPRSALIRKEIVQQHLGDPNLGPQEAVLYDAGDRPLITQRQVRVVPRKQR